MNILKKCQVDTKALTRCEEVQELKRLGKKEDQKRLELTMVEANWGDIQKVALPLGYVIEHYHDLKFIQDGFLASLKYTDDLTTTLGWAYKARAEIYATMRFYAIRLDAALAEAQKDDVVEPWVYNFAAYA